MTGTEPVVLRGRARLLGTGSGEPEPAEVTLLDGEFALGHGSRTRVVAYRDLATVAVQAGAVLVVLGAGHGAVRFLLDQFGPQQGRLARELRERRLRQRLADAMVRAFGDPIDLVEFERTTGAGSTPEHGVGQLVYHPWGAVLAPVDERVAWSWIRRAAVGDVALQAGGGDVTVQHGSAAIRLMSLGPAARVHADRFASLRDGAAIDAGQLVGRLIPDASYAARQRAALVLVDGRPASPVALGDAWPALEAAVLTEPAFAESYAALRARGGGADALRWIAIAPTEPGSDQSRRWFFVGLPGNLVALELVSEGAHATYCFRVVPRAQFSGSTDPEEVRRAVREVSDALVDARFLREPMAIPEDHLGQPRYLRYRLALASLPALAAARARFVARLVHRDIESWAKSLDDLIAWHASSRDDSASWPGRAAQEAQVEQAEGEP